MMKGVEFSGCLNWSLDFERCGPNARGSMLSYLYLSHVAASTVKLTDINR